MLSVCRLARLSQLAALQNRTLLLARPTQAAIHQRRWRLAHTQAATTNSIEKVDVANSTPKIEPSHFTRPTEDLVVKAKWAIPEEVEKVEVVEWIQGAIVPFNQLYLVQKIFFPYTFFVMYYLEQLTVYMPWWAAIASLVATVKVAFLPLIIKSEKLLVKTHNLEPQIQKIRAQLSEAYSSGQQHVALAQRAKMNELLAKNDVRIRDRLLPLLLQAPMFMSMFFLFRVLTNQPVESLTTGGALWFTDLSIADPYYALPAIVGASLFAILSRGIAMEGGGGKSFSAMSPLQKGVVIGMPIGLTWFVSGMPAALTFYFAINNTITLLTSELIRRPYFRSRLGLPTKKKHDVADLPLANQTFMDQYKQAMEKSSTVKSTADLRRLDDIAFRKAGIGPLKKTYKTPPIKSST